MDKNKSTMPPLPGHPEPFAMAWTELELREIEEYGMVCWNAAITAALEKIPSFLAASQQPAAAPAEQAQGQAAEKIEDPVVVPRGLLGAACFAIEHKRDAPNILAKLRSCTTGPRSKRPIPPRDQALCNDGKEPDWAAYAEAEAQQGVSELPTLPEPWITDGNTKDPAAKHHYAEDQMLDYARAALAQRAGSAKPSPSEGPVVDMTEALLTEDEEDALYESIRMKLESHRMVRMFDIEEDGSLGNSHHLIDRLSLDASDISGADISTGKEEIESIIDTVFNGAKEYAMSIIAKRIHDRACTCWKCLAEFESAKPSEQAEAQSKAGVSVDTPTIWSMSPALGVMVPNSPRQANREQFYAVDEANAHTARAVAEALEGQLTEMGPRGALYLPQAWPDAWHALRDDVLSGVDGLDNDQINIVLGMLDNYEPVATIQPSQLAGAVQEPIDIIKEGNFSNRFEWVSDEVATNSLLIGMNVYAFATPAAVQSAPIDDATPVEAKPVAWSYEVEHGGEWLAALHHHAPLEADNIRNIKPLIFAHTYSAQGGALNQPDSERDAALVAALRDIKGLAFSNRRGVGARILAIQHRVTAAIAAAVPQTKEV